MDKKYDIQKYKEVFLMEGKEHIEAMDSHLLKFEKQPSKLAFISQVFREVHTLKSMAATMEYVHTAQLCHAMEDVLDALKNKKIKVNKCIDILFECCDILNLTLKKLKEGKGESDSTVLIAKIRNLNLQIAPHATADATDKKNQISRLSVPSDEELAASSAIAKIESINVKVESLDRLMNLAEELLINKMRLDRIKGQAQNAELTAAVDILGRLVSEVQYSITQARMVPISFVFNRFPRMVRDLAKHQGKQVDLEVEGEGIELDRAIIDEIGESLVHLLRNSIDHGIETPQERRDAGKPGLAKIRIEASRTKNSAVIKVTDDGRGLNFEEIKNTAVRRGDISQQASKAEIMNSIFTGVSTTKQVTALSGRGFGLNIVKNKIESLGGSIKVESERGVHTIFTLEIPLTLAIIKALFVKAAENSYAIPLSSIERLMTVDQKDIKGMMNYEAIVVNEEDIPITRLDILFSLPEQKLQKQPIVIVRKGRGRLGLAVNAFLTTQEIVIKPLNKTVGENKYFSGTTIIGSGDVVLILDTANLLLTKKEQPQPV